MQHAFCLSLPLFCTTTTVFCGTKTSNFLVTHDFYRGIVVCAYPILSPVFMFTFIFHCRSFSPCWPLVVVASICHTRNFISYTRENKLRLTIAANTQYKWYKIYVHGLFNPRPAGYSIKLCSQRLRPEVQSLTLKNTILTKGTPFVHLPLKSCTLYICFVRTNR